VKTKLLSRYQYWGLHPFDIQCLWQTGTCFYCRYIHTTFAWDSLHKQGSQDQRLYQFK